MATVTSSSLSWFGWSSLNTSSGWVFAYLNPFAPPLIFSSSQVVSSATHTISVHWLFHYWALHPTYCNDSIQFRFFAHNPNKNSLDYSSWLKIALILCWYNRLHCQASLWYQQTHLGFVLFLPEMQLSTRERINYDCVSTCICTCIQSAPPC